MASKMVIIKEIRPSKKVPWHTKTPEQEALEDATMEIDGIRVMRTVDIFKAGLKRVEILFFTKPEFYERWADSPVFFDAAATRSAHNEAHGIIERTFEKDFPNLNI